MTLGFMARARTTITSNTYDFFVQALSAFDKALEIEADRRLYVSPALGVQELLMLHVLQCSEIATGKSTLKQVAVSLSLSEGYVAAVAGKLRTMRFLDDKNKPTRAYGVPAVSIVQYVHGAWADGYFGELLTRDKLASLKKVSRAVFLPSLLFEARSFLEGFGVDAKSTMDLSLDDAMLMILIADHHRVEGRSPTIRELSLFGRANLDALYPRAEALRKRGLLTRIDFDLTRKGQDLSEAFRKAVEKRSVDIRARLLDP